MSLNLPIVRYSQLLRPPQVGSSAVVVIAGEHPTLGNLEDYDNIVTTSTVMQVIGTNGAFRTRNTYYVPECRA